MEEDTRFWLVFPDPPYTNNQKKKTVKDFLFLSFLFALSLPRDILIRGVDRELSHRDSLLSIPALYTNEVLPPCRLGHGVSFSSNLKAENQKLQNSLNRMENIRWLANGTVQVTSVNPMERNKKNPLRMQQIQGLFLGSRVWILNSSYWLK